MLPGTFQAVLTALLVVIYYTIDIILMAHYAQERDSRKSGRNWKYTLFMLATAAVLISQPVIASGLSWHMPLSWGIWIQILGIILMGLGLIIHVWARIHLGRFYAERVEVLVNHQVITSGPYAYVRHPIILSFFLFAIGLFLINPSLPTALLLIYTCWDFSGAARKEEQKLSQLPGYADYLQCTPRFFPNVRRMLYFFKRR